FRAGSKLWWLRSGSLDRSTGRRGSRGPRFDLERAGRGRSAHLGLAPYTRERRGLGCASAERGHEGRRAMSDTVGSALGPRASVTRAMLVVEADVDVRETLEDILESEGYTVTTAANGQEALERLSGAALPCVVLLDLMMPVMNGREFLAALRRDPVLANL